MINKINNQASIDVIIWDPTLIVSKSYIREYYIHRNKRMEF